MTYYIKNIIIYTIGISSGKIPTIASKNKKEQFMKNKKLSLLSLLLVTVMLLGALASCTNTPETTTESTTPPTTEATSKVTTEATEKTEATSPEGDSEAASSDAPEASDVETDSDGDKDSDSLSATESIEIEETEEPLGTETLFDKDENHYVTEKESNSILEMDYAGLIENADYLKNGITSYYLDANRNYYRVENNNMNLGYTLTAQENQLVSITNKAGKSYIKDTMDVFIKTTEGTYFASESQRAAVANLYRYGYYHYDVHFYDQDFVNETTITAEKAISLKQFNKKTDMTDPEVINGVLTSSITSPYDPQIRAEKMKAVSTSDYNALRITMKTDYTSTVSLFIIAGSYKNYSEEQRVDFAVKPDGEYHTYIVNLDEGIIDDYQGDIIGLRLDFNGAAGDVIEISEVTAVKVSNGGAPNVRMDRNFHTYTDKMHQTIRLFALTEVKNIEEIGMITRIEESTVAKLVVKDANGTHDTLEGVDWESARYIGFDIIDAGIFGYIMPDHADSGKMTVTLEDGYYVILQTTCPENGTLKAPVPATSNRDQVVIDFQGTSIDPYHSESEFDFGHRVYTDANHDFTKFIFEAECELNPLTSDNIVINEEKSPGSTFDGYDPLRGIYCFTVKESVTFHQGYYYQQNKHCPVSFKITGDDRTRNIYVLAYAFATSIECAAILDKNDMMLPVPLEVSKNFSNEFEEPIYAWGDIRYSEVRFPMIINAGETQELTVLHLYQNWGQFPLKQISSIQFFAPYYHLSTGCSESNCIASYYVKNKDLQTLPDHRAMSAPIWDSDPQHTNGGFHYWLQYTDIYGNYYASEDKVNIINSAGPTYADIDLTYLSDDGKIKVTYNHMEMPQTDENRTYYQMNYEVLADVSFKDFSRDFSFYSVHGMGNYDHIGYLDTDNKSQVVDTGKDGQETMYKLGDDLPYFDMFEISTGHNKDDYVNVSFMIYSSEFIIGGEKVTPGFVIVDKNYTVRLSLDLERVTLKKGDKFTINAIIMPWGSQETNYNVKNPDKNVLDVRKYNLRDPLKVTPLENTEVIESVFLPQVKSTNGKTVEFTLSGGEGNTTFRAYGFDKLTAPKLYEQIEKEITNEDGETTIIKEWVLVDVSSAYTPDSYGNAHTYDGYAVHYDSDGSFSYSFVVAMEGNAKRTFRVDASEDFTEWPEVEVFVPSSEVYFSSNNLMESLTFKTGTVITEDGKKFIRVTGNGEAGEHYFNLPIAAPSCGDLLVIKYRIPTTNKVNHGLFQVYTSTTSSEPSDPNYSLIYTAKQDGEWHVMVVDLSAFNMPEFIANEDGTYSIKHMRFDFINSGSQNPFSATDYIDFQYISICKTMEEVAEMSGDMAYIDLVQGELISSSIPVSGLGGVNESDFFNLFFSADSLYAHPHVGNGFGKIELAKDSSYVRYYGNGAASEACLDMLYTGGTKVTGKYFVLKYRLPTSNVENPSKNFIEYFTATSGNGPTGTGDNISTEGDNLLIKDGEWHVLVLDVTSKPSMTEYQPDADGKYSAAYIRIDLFNGQVMSANSYMDVAFFGVCEDPTEYLKYIGESDDNTETEPEDPTAKYFDLYISAEDLSLKALSGNFGDVVLSEDKSFVSLYGDGKTGEGYFTAYSNGKTATGQYFVVKYRIPTTNAENPDDGYFEFYTSTVNSSPKGPGDESDFAATVGEKLLIKDGEWHVFVLDVTSKTTCKTYLQNENGEYVAKFIRFDVFNQIMSTDSYIDIAFLAVCDDPSEYLASLEATAE